MNSKISKKNEIPKVMMKLIMGGVAAQEYCETLFNIVMNNWLDKAACEGANYGSAKAGCGFEIDCSRH